MTNLRQDIDLYLQKLLALQFEASKNISHKPTKGEVREKFARVGNLPVYELSDCKLFMEIKSDAKHSEMVALNTIAGEIHRRSHEIDENARVIVGMFCYSTEASEKTVLKKFGFRYDNDFQGYCAYDASKDIFKEINFLFSLNITEDGALSPYIVIRDIFGGCSLYNANPIITNFFNFFRQ